MIEELFRNKKAVSPVIAIVLLLMMTVAAAGAAYFWFTSMQSRMQKSAGGRIEAITKSVSTRVIAQATICEGINEVNLKGYWKHDLGEGNETYDSSGNGNNGTLEDANTSNEGGSWEGPDWVEGKVGKALEFDGVDDYVDLPGREEGYVGSSPNYITLSAWVKTTQSGFDLAIGGSYRHNSLGVKDGRVWTEFAFQNGDVVDVEGSPVNDGNWHLIAVVVDGTESTGNIKLYLDGRLDATGSGGDGTGIKVQNWQWDIGRQQGGGNEFNGTIDEVRIYDKALIKAQVEYLNDTNKAMGRYVNITVYNAGTEEVPEGAWIANLKKDGTTVDSDSYNASKLPPEERITLNFYFDKMKPNKEYTIELEGTQTSTTVSC